MAVQFLFSGGEQYIYIYIYVCVCTNRHTHTYIHTNGGALREMVMVVRNGHGDTSSNPGRVLLHSTWC